jgi:predicted dehydrogenase
MQQVGIGFIGCGDVARIHKEALLRIPIAKLVAVYSRTEARARKLVSDIGARVCKSADELVSADGVDVVFVLSPEASHHEHVMRALRAGKHTFVEKPVSFSREEILEWIRLSEEKSCLCVPAHNYIHAPAIRSAKELITSGQLGDIHSLWILFMLLLPPEIRNRIPGPLREVMIHHFYSMLYLVGKPQSVLAANSDFTGRGLRQADQAMVVCKLPGGGLATLFASFSVDDLTCDPWSVIYKVIGTRGSASHTWSQSRLSDRPQPIWDLPAYWETFREEDRYFIEECIVGGRKPLSSMQDALTCLEILAAAEESIQSGASQVLLGANS